MPSDWKVKTEERTSTSTAWAISRKEKETVFEENTDSNSPYSASDKIAFKLPEIKRFARKSNPMSFTKNWYSKPTPPNMRTGSGVIVLKYIEKHWGF